jgi:hypothetical protein
VLDESSTNHILRELRNQEPSAPRSDRIAKTDITLYFNKCNRINREAQPQDDNKTRNQ